MTRPLFGDFFPHIVRPVWAEQVITGAYDAVSPSERQRLTTENPYNYLNVTRSPGDNPGGGDDIEGLLANGRASLNQLFEVDAFEPPTHAGLLIYRLRLGDHSQTGIVGLMPVEALQDGRIRKHEGVRPARADLLARHLEVVGAASSPVALSHRPNLAMHKLISEIEATPPNLDVDAGGVHQTVWRTTQAQSDRLRELFEGETLYITDGHHRSAATEVAAARNGSESPYGSILAVSFPAEQLRVLPFHRRVSHTNDLSPQQLVARIGDIAKLHELSESANKRPANPGEVTLYHDHAWYSIVLPEGGVDPVSKLDVMVLQDKIMSPILGIADQSADPALEFVADPVGIDELVRRCDDDGGVAFVVAATSVEEIMEVADSHELMPPKSSYFNPKPRSGVFLRLLSDEWSASD